MAERGYLTVEVLLIGLLTSSLIVLGGMYAYADRLLAMAINQTTASCLAQKELVCAKSKMLNGVKVIGQIEDQYEQGVLFRTRIKVTPRGSGCYDIAVTVGWDECGAKREVVLATAVIADET